MGSLAHWRSTKGLRGSAPTALPRVRSLPIDSGRSLRSVGSLLKRCFASCNPLGRAAEAEEVADLVAYLLSRGARYLNGVTVPVDGGRAVLGLDPEHTPDFFAP